MGLATIDPHSQKEHTEIHKIPKFGVNQSRFIISNQINAWFEIRIYYIKSMTYDHITKNLFSK